MVNLLEIIFWNLNKELDQRLVYKNKKTGEYICFDKSGMWNTEGLKHSDLATFKNN